jgi:hypothetical protein
MTAADMSRWDTALHRLTAGYDWHMPADQADAWFDQLERYPIAAVEQALRAAPSESGRYKPTVGMVEQLARKAVADDAYASASWAPGVSRDADGVVVARWRCVFCEDTGWRATLADTGQLLTNDELIRRQAELRIPRADRTPAYRMTRCACKASSHQQGVA